MENINSFTNYIQKLRKVKKVKFTDLNQEKFEKISIENLKKTIFKLLTTK